MDLLLYGSLFILLSPNQLLVPFKKPFTQDLGAVWFTKCNVNEM
jgi:hypothetical protein